MLVQYDGNFIEEIDAFEPVEEEIVVNSTVTSLRQDVFHVVQEHIDLLGDEVFCGGSGIVGELKRVRRLTVVVWVSRDVPLVKDRFMNSRSILRKKRWLSREVAEEVSSDIAIKYKRMLKQWIKTNQQIEPFSPPFNSRSPRMLTEVESLSPGPGSYDYKQPASNSKRVALPKHNDGIDTQFQWMFNDERSRALTQSSGHCPVGPGAYEPHQTTKSPKLTWSKSSRFVIQTAAQLPGPGSYDYSKVTTHGSAAQSSFKSRIPKLPLPPTPSQPQTNDLHSDIEEEQSESEEREQTPRKNTKKSCFFASKVPRFVTQGSAVEVGPGSYNLSNQQHTKMQLPRVVKAFSQKRKKLGLKKGDVGPGSYNLGKYEMGRLVEFKGYAVARETRFNFRGKKNVSMMLPGPGEYMKQKYLLIDPQKMQSTRNQKPIKTTSQYQLDSKKISPTPQVGPGDYDLGLFNIEFKARQRREHIDRLKMMELSVPAFNNRVPRLT